LNKKEYIKIAIWIYFLLWIFEGGLRKWILPSLSAPLLVVRDPVAIYIIYKSLKDGIRFSNYFIKVTLFVTLIDILLCLMIGHQNIFVALYGGRIMLLHFPIIFIIGTVFSKDDVLKIGRFIIQLTPFMVLLIGFQFFSPQSAWVNVGVGGEGSSGFSGASGYFRPSATFSFISGTALFLPLSAAFNMYFMLNKVRISKFILLLNIICIIVVLPLTISRSTIGAVALVVLFTIISLKDKKIILNFIIGFFIISMTVVILNNTEVFKLGTEVMLTRFESASNSEGTVGDSFNNRLVQGIFGPILRVFEVPFFAGNIGLGTNVGAVLSTGERTFLLSEGEVGRVLAERGIITGITIMSIRFILLISLALKSWRYNMQKKDSFSWILFSTVFLSIIQGQWAQPTSLGFSVLVLGFVVALVKKDNHEVNLIET
jgi:hypothetical protein